VALDRVIGAVLAAALAATGCSATTSGGAEDFEASTALTEILELDPAVAVEMQKTYDQRHQALVEECMKALGYDDYQPQSAPVVADSGLNPTEPSSERRNVRYGVEQAWDDRVVSVPPASFGPAEAEGLFGTEESPGCVEQSHRQLGEQLGLTGDPAADLLLLDLVDAVETAVDSAPEVQVLEQEWSGCMALRGHEFETVADPGRFFVAEVNELTRIDWELDGSPKAAEDIADLIAIEAVVASDAADCGEGQIAEARSLARIRIQNDLGQEHQALIIDVLERERLRRTLLQPEE